jgi:hypothetical protein
MEKISIRYFKRLVEVNTKQASYFHKKLKVADKAQVLSYKVAEIAAQQMKPHTTTESLILHACHVMVTTMLEDNVE